MQEWQCTTEPKSLCLCSSKWQQLGTSWKGLVDMITLINTWLWRICYLLDLNPPSIGAEKELGNNPSFIRKLRSLLLSFLGIIGALVHEGGGSRSGGKVQTAVAMTEIDLGEWLRWISSALFQSIRNAEDQGAWGQALICVKWQAPIIRLPMKQQGPIAMPLVQALVTIYATGGRRLGKKPCQGSH